MGRLTLVLALIAELILFLFLTADVLLIFTTEVLTLCAAFIGEILVTLFSTLTGELLVTFSAALTLPLLSSWAPGLNPDGVLYIHVLIPANLEAENIL